MSNNNNRVKRGQAAVKAYLEVYANGGSDLENLTDLLIDLRHWAEFFEVNFEKASDYSANHYNTERSVDV